MISIPVFEETIKRFAFAVLQSNKQRSNPCTALLDLSTKDSEELLRENKTTSSVLQTIMAFEFKTIFAFREKNVELFRETPAIDE